ncbi:hypothetical protein AAur_3196 [Paenarthrobacter aurescens TC1]|uniref:Uncharacterized protein n=2 Tax=Paenarthrobacter aurescens TaxID=43663 RepID=A1R9I1_PAEAT|nr:hypothetical protein AAur_3196 [Paenarthrobacter aurescens TC1]
MRRPRRRRIGPVRREARSSQRFLASRVINGPLPETTCMSTQFCSITPWGKEPKMKYRRSGNAKYATLVTLTLALTLAACASSTPVASSSFTSATEEANTLALSPAAPMEETLAAPASEQGTPPQLSEPALVNVSVPVVAAPVAPIPVQEETAPAPAAPTAPAVAIDPVVPAPPLASPPPATIPPSSVPPVSTPTAPEITPITPAEPSTPHVSPSYPQIGLFTFPDGHISFLLPAGWTAQTEEEPVFGEDHYADDDHFVVAQVYDETGDNVARIYSGAGGGVVGGPVNRTILDSQKLTAFDSRYGASHFAFFKDEYPFDTTETRYFMGVVAEPLMTEGPDSTSASSFLIMGNGAASATAHIDVSMSAEDAEAWMETEQYRNVKALLTSIKYAE